jgi:hypothetical protein
MDENTAVGLIVLICVIFSGFFVWLGNKEE